VGRKARGALPRGSWRTPRGEKPMRRPCKLFSAVFNKCVYSRHFKCISHCLQKRRNLGFVCSSCFSCCFVLAPVCSSSLGSTTMVGVGAMFIGAGQMLIEIVDELNVQPDNMPAKHLDISAAEGGSSRFCRSPSSLAFCSSLFRFFSTFSIDRRCFSFSILTYRLFSFIR
jgi:hypothetical protein